jgi:glycosyltransferase involved in cell wall biosynthesis
MGQRARPRLLEAGASWVQTAASTIAAYGWWARTAAAARLGHVGARRQGPGRTLALLAWYLPPVVSGGTYRPLALLRYASRLGWNVVAVSGQPWAPPDEAARHLLESLPEAVRVERVETPGLRPSHSWFPRIDGGLLTALATFDASARALDGVRPDVVVASGPPFHLFPAGYYLARRHRCPLVIVYRDEWTQSPFEFVKLGNADGVWERRCLAAADRVVFTTASQLEHAVRVFAGLDRGKCLVIPNGWEPADWAGEPDGPDQPGTGPQPLTLSYVGNLHSHTPPDDFLAALGQVIRLRPGLASMLRLRFVGQKSPVSLQTLGAFPVPGMVELVDQLPRPAANRLMRQSGALLLLNDPRLARYVPGKLYEYLASRRPVLVFGEGGESADLVRRLQAGLVVPAGDPGALGQALERLCREPVTPGDPMAISDWLARHTRERLARDTLEMLDSLLGGTTSRP